MFVNTTTTYIHINYVKRIIQQKDKKDCKKTNRKGRKMYIRKKNIQRQKKYIIKRKIRKTRKNRRQKK
ncbi:hypothetical protein O3E_00805 [Candidatus Portiera aleyrodidarum MED (Bemisia tabaci)]|uniref:Uncharacterized protein n=1 Tax=Candidatus Portiera aleyrodidarum MED (Bemisia tabaci) TaxID=1163752 RepID=A0AAU8RQR8_9GAMM|nr:hypothetical protein C548_128 [Candidatus Portiera aleyrodidarum BT-QVLC]AFT80774.1 hypothetical protein C530_130 [Candidatus Portiera aleyrodidarum BT-B-HRs]AJF24076.1 hypothetical protein O3E_00805 [Candidatus Portiera aleyrodidarum MED (Bemisia tabaci)]ASX27103.1 hypothetical protein BA172_00050 [Candidatus Portiera aleyrodidarum MED (Bemisia tabaci)]